MMIGDSGDLLNHNTKENKLLFHQEMKNKISKANNDKQFILPYLIQIAIISSLFSFVLNLVNRTICEMTQKDLGSSYLD